MFIAKFTDFSNKEAIQIPIHVIETDNNSINLVKERVIEISLLTVSFFDPKLIIRITILILTNS